MTVCILANIDQVEMKNLSVLPWNWI